MFLQQFEPAGGGTRSLRARHRARGDRQRAVHDGHVGGAEAHGPVLETGHDNRGLPHLRDAQELPRLAGGAPAEGAD